MEKLTFNLEPRIELLQEIELTGLALKMSLSDNKTVGLWSNFMSGIRQTNTSRPKTLYSLQLYPADYFHGFDPQQEFVKWAAADTVMFNVIPDGMEQLIVPPGLYAVFNYRGPGGDPAIFHYIYGQWLPQSGHILDQRPHFEILGEKYKQNSPESEEEIWIPIED